MTAQPPTAIYAELLSNIRQISVVASLSSPADSSTKAEISHEGRRLNVTHQDQTESITLPAQTSVSGALPVAKTGRPSLSWRLPISPAEAKPAQFSLENQALPWTSVDIAVGSPIGCRNCENEFVAQGTVITWKDLPSENWAEMMEFWHCHKPHDHEHQDPESLASKGYGANHAISAQKGTGFVDLTSFLFSESDCQGLKVSIDPMPLILLSPMFDHTSKWGERRCPYRVFKPFSDLAIDTTPQYLCTCRSHPNGLPAFWKPSAWNGFLGRC